MHSGWMEKRRGGTERAKHRQYSMYSRSSLHRTLSRVCLSDERCFLYIIYNSVPPSGVCASSRFSRTTVVPPLFLRLSYPHPLRPESCSCEFLHECKRRVGTALRIVSVYLHQLWILSTFPLFFLLPSFSCPFLVPSSFLLSFSFSRLRVRGHEPYRGNSTFVFVFRRRRWQNRKNRQDGRNGEREKCREVNEKVTYIFAVYKINTRLIIESPRKEITHS